MFLFFYYYQNFDSLTLAVKTLSDKMASNGRVVGQGCEKSSKAKKQARNRANRAKAKAGAKAKAEASADKMVAQAFKVIDKVGKQADDLGVNRRDVKGFDKLDDLIIELDDKSADIANYDFNLGQ